MDDFLQNVILGQTHCASCLDPVETTEGIIDLDHEGRCDYCRERQEKAQIAAESYGPGDDFDHSMDH